MKIVQIRDEIGRCHTEKNMNDRTNVKMNFITTQQAHLESTLPLKNKVDRGELVVCVAKVLL